MTLARASGTLGLAALAVTASPFAVGADSGGYIGGNVGRSISHFDEAAITRSVAPASTAVSITKDDHDTGFKLFGGYQFNRNFALEGGYFDLGKFDFTAITAPAGTLTGNMKVKGVNVDAVGILPFTEKFSVFGRIGLQYAETKDSFARTPPVVVINPNPSSREWNPKIGFGIQYAFTESLGMRVEAERYRINDAVGNRGDIDLISIGLVYRFGGKTPAPAPRPAVMRQPPPPQAVTPPPPRQAEPPPAPPRQADTPPAPPSQKPRQDRY